MITGLPEERAAKLTLLESIAQSQAAMARILDTLADITSYSEETAVHLAHEAERMTRYQEAMMKMLAGLSLPPQYFGVPEPPWINTDLAVAVEAPHGRTGG